MEPLAHHIISRLVDDRVIGTTPARRRRLARCFLERDRRFRLVAFRAVDTHLHSLVIANREDAGEFARRVEISIQNSLRPGAPFSTPNIKPVGGQRHLRNAFEYILDQEHHHGLRTDPLHDAGNLPDLLGLRVLAPWTATEVRRYLPRVRRSDLLEHLPDPQRLIADESLGLGQLPALADAAAAALCLPGIRGRRPEAHLARAAAVAIGRDLVSSAVLATQLGLSTRTVQRLSSVEVSEEVLAAVMGQVRLRTP